MPVPGSQSAIQLLPRLRAATKVAVLSPTYNEHGSAWRDAGHEVYEVANLEEVDDDFSVLVVTNPNNPDGRFIDNNHLEVCRKNLARRGGWLVLDEAFADAAPNLSMASLCDRSGLLILRSFGKFFGLAGLRLGFVLAQASLSKKIIKAVGPWAVSGPALAVASEALADTKWQIKMQAQLAADSAKLDNFLTDAGIEVVGGTLLFRLGQIETASALFEALAKSGILTRRFENKFNLLRFGLPGTEEEWERLKQAITA